MVSEYSEIINVLKLVHHYKATDLLAVEVNEFNYIFW